MSNIIYSDEFELLLKEEAEKSESMSILHSKAFQKYNWYSIIINVPVIVLSATIGFLSPLAIFNKQEILLGALSIFVGILKTFDSYFDFTKKSECHRMTSLNYVRISKWIQLQLSLERNCRVNPKDLYDTITNDLQAIRESEPVITKDIIKTYNIQYKDENTAKPPICNGLTNVKINKKIIEIPKIEVIEDKKINIITEPKIDIKNDSKIPKPFKV